MLKKIPTIESGFSCGKIKTAQLLTTTRIYIPFNAHLTRGRPSSDLAPDRTFTASIHCTSHMHPDCRVNMR